jgi:competence protein ComEC
MSKAKKKNFIKLLRAVACFAFILAACLLYRSENKNKPKYDSNVYDNTVTVLNVGQASCSLIQSNGKFALIDAGWAEGGVDIITYLKSRNVKTIEVIALTHFHSDHTSQVLELLRNFEVKSVLIPDLSIENTPTTSFYKTLAKKAEKGQFKLELCEKGKKINVGEGVINVVSNTYNDGSINDTSLILTFTQDDFVYLDMGDAGSSTQAKILDDLPDNVDLLDSPHHGSRDASSKQLYEKINPQLVVFSCGGQNSYGHPHKEVLKLTEEKSIPYLITNEYGNVVYSMKEKKVLKEVH